MKRRRRPTATTGEKPISIEPGKALERECEHLLRLTAYDVKRETLLGHKKVDLYFEHKELARGVPTVVECKDYPTRLSQIQANSIYSDYRPLIEAGQVDLILITTRNGLTPTAEALIRASSGSHPPHHGEFNRSVMERLHRDAKRESTTSLASQASVLL